MTISRQVWIALGLALVAPLSGCGGEDDGPVDAGADAGLDAAMDAAGAADVGTRPDATADPDAATCTAAAPVGRFVSRSDNPRLRAGRRFADGLLDVTIADPDVHWDAAASSYRAYFMAARGSSFAGPLVQAIRRMDSSDGVSWTVADAPALVASSAPTAWDHGNTETPTVVMNPDAPPARRYLMMYSGANAAVPGQPFPAYGIGAAFSPDGVSFTRVSAAESPHGEAGLVLTGAQLYPGASGALVADPELVYRDGRYSLWFSSFSCQTVRAPCDTVTRFGIGHATSVDGVHWTPAPQNPLPSLLRDPTLAASGGQQPSVVWDPRRCRYELWLTSDLSGENDDQPIEFNNMVGVFHATSADGVAWQVDYTGARDLTWNPAAPGQPLGLLTGADVAARGEQRLMLYVGFDDQSIPPDFYLPDRTAQGFRPGVMALEVATRD